MKNGESWLIEVKTGDRPPVTINNLVRMLEQRRGKRVNKVALIFVPEAKRPLLLFTMDKNSYVALKASIKRIWRQAGKKSWRKRRRVRT
jgi:hypothetical protein